MEFERNVTTRDLADMLLASNDKLKTLVTRYVKSVETDLTAAICKCTWRIHPEDIDIPENHCRACGHQKDCMHHDMITSTEEGGHEFKGRRKVPVDSHAECPVHTKEGFLLGFFEWAKNQTG